MFTEGKVDGDKMEMDGRGSKSMTELKGLLEDHESRPKAQHSNTWRERCKRGKYSDFMIVSYLRSMQGKYKDMRTISQAPSALSFVTGAVA
jgi:hypothetical protein